MYQEETDDRQQRVTAQKKRKERISTENDGLGGRCCEHAKIAPPAPFLLEAELRGEEEQVNLERDSGAKMRPYSLESRQSLTKLKPRNARNRQ